MKIKYILIALLASMLSLRANIAKADYDYDYDLYVVSEDTVEILFGDNSKIVILVNSKEDLEKIQKYDLNAMLKELNVKVEESSDESKVLVIEDETGKKYLKDTTLVVNEKTRNPEFDAMEREFDREFNSNNSSRENYSDNKDKYDNWWENTENQTKTRVVRGQRTKHRSFMDFGMNNYMSNGSFPDQNNEPYTVKPWGSWYVALGSSFQTRIAGKLGLEWGANLSWYNFKFQDPSQKIMQDENSVFWEPATEPNPGKSKLTATYLNATLVPVLDFGYHTRIKNYDDGRVAKYINHDSKKFRIGMGGYVGYKIDSYSKFVYHDDGKKKDHSKKGYYVDNFRYGLRFVLGYDDVDLFVNYDLNNLFYENKGPELNAFSFGISF